MKGFERVRFQPRRKETKYQQGFSLWGMHLTTSAAAYRSRAKPLSLTLASSGGLSQLFQNDCVSNLEMRLPWVAACKMGVPVPFGDMVSGRKSGFILSRHGNSGHMKNGLSPPLVQPGKSDRKLCE